MVNTLLSLASSRPLVEEVGGVVEETGGVVEAGGVEHLDEYPVSWPPEVQFWRCSSILVMPADSLLLQSLKESLLLTVDELSSSVTVLLFAALVDGRVSQVFMDISMQGILRSDKLELLPDKILNVGLASLVFMKDSSSDVLFALGVSLTHPSNAVDKGEPDGMGESAA